MALPLHDHTPCTRRPASRRAHLVLVTERSGPDAHTGPEAHAGSDRSEARARNRQASSVRPLRTAPSVYRRRRLLVGVVVGAFCVLVSLGAARFDAAGAGATPRSDTVVRVRPGETMWSVAQSLDTGRDVRSVVAELVDANGGNADLVAGQALVIPSGLAGHLDRR